MTQLGDVLEGQTIRITDAENGRTYLGIVKEVNLRRKLIRLSNCKDVETNRSQPGFQDFLEDQIDDIKVVDETEPSEPQIGVAVSKSVKPKLQTLSLNRRNADNPHLKRLHQIDMHRQLNQIQYNPTPPLPVNRDDSLSLPRPGQTVDHMDGEKFKDRMCLDFYEVRERCWESQNEPPPLKYCPTVLHVIDEVDGVKYRNAIKELRKEHILGVGLEGEYLSRLGRLSLLSFATARAIFMFDVVKMEMTDNLRELHEIFEDRSIMKVFHDVRRPTDILHHIYGVRLENCYDTLAAHIFNLTWCAYGGFVPKYAAAYTNVCRAYLGIRSDHLFFPHFRQSYLREDTRIWIARPLPDRLRLGAARNVMYLQDLMVKTREVMHYPFRNIITNFMSSIAKLSDISAELQLYEQNNIPDHILSFLPNFRKRQDVGRKIGPIEEDFVHQCVGQVDPSIIFSRDVMHQNKRCPEY